MFFRLLIMMFGVCLASLPASANRSVNYGKYQAWTIVASYDAQNRFALCSASSLYTSGTRFSIIYYAQQSNWVLQFFHTSWPERTGNTPITLAVDGRLVTRTNARFYKRSVFVDLGSSIDRVQALMRGNRLSVATGSGTSAFSLKGSSGATVRVAQCVKANFNAGGSSAGAGAFGTPQQGATQGAFSTPAPQPAAKGRNLKATRGDTLDHALTYLNKSKVTYKLLPEQSNYFKNFPVNWSYGPNSYGGMMILRNVDQPGPNQLGQLLGDQARLCTEKSATARKPVERDGNTTIHRATGACSTGGKQYALHYTVIEGQAGGSQILIIEMLHAGDAGATPGNAGEKDWKIDKIEPIEKL